MSASIIRTAGSENTEFGKCFYSLEFPALDIPSVSDFYKTMSMRLVKSLKADRLKRLERLGTESSASACRSLITRCRVCFCDSEYASVYFDIRHFLSDELVLFRRSAQNWRISKNHTELMSFPKCEKLFFSPDGFYFFDRHSFFAFENLFRTGDGRNLRRSEEEKFIRSHEILLN